MNLKRLFSALLCCSCLVFSGTFSSYADTATSSNADYVPTWQEAVEAVKAERAAASASEADIMTLDLSDEDYGIMPFSSVGTVTNTVDRTGVTLVYGYTDLNGIERIKTSYLKADGSFKIEFDGVLNYFGFEFSSVALPSAGKYEFSYDISSDFSFDYGYTKLQYHKYNSNANTEFSQLVTSTLINQSSGDLYLSPQIVTLGSYGSQTNGFGAIHFVNGITNVFSGSVRFSFVKYSGDEEGFVSPGSTSGDVQADYQSGVTSSLGSIGDTLEEIVETISLQLEALWNQMYNYIHLPEYEKLEQIRQAIENIRLDVDVDNQDVVNKLDEQISNDNANTQKVEEAVEKHGNFIIEGLKSLFIPDEEYFTGLFDRLNTFFSERLGFLYTPFDLLIRILEAFMTADTSTAGIPFPGIIVGEWRLLEPQTVTFDFLDEFPGLQDKIYFATNTVMIGAFLSLLSRKIKEVMNR